MYPEITDGALGVYTYESNRYSPDLENGGVGYVPPGRNGERVALSAEFAAAPVEPLRKQVPDVFRQYQVLALPGYF